MYYRPFDRSMHLWIINEIFNLLERTITRVFVFLSDKEQDRVPSIAEKLSLKSSGLGEKTVLHGKDETNQKCSTACCEYR